MPTKEELCHKIKEVFPEIGSCGINLKVDYDDSEKAWVVDLKKGDQNSRPTSKSPKPSSAWRASSASRWACRSGSYGKISKSFNRLIRGAEAVTSAPFCCI